MCCRYYAQAHTGPIYLYQREKRTAGRQLQLDLLNRKFRSKGLAFFLFTLFEIPFFTRPDRKCSLDMVMNGAVYNESEGLCL